jgi:hypothetical protein
MLYLGRSATVSDQSETRSPTGSMFTIRSMASASTHSGNQVLACLARVLPPSSYLWTAFLIFLIFQLLSRSSMSCRPLLRSRAADDATISNQTIVYPGDLRVIALTTVYNIHDGPWQGICPATGAALNWAVV